MAKQKHLPTLEPPSHKDLDRLAERYLEARNAWQSLHQPMMNACDLLEAKMKEKGLKVYEFDDNVVEFNVKEKLRVRKKSDGGDNGEE